MQKRIGAPIRFLLAQRERIVATQQSIVAEENKGEETLLRLLGSSRELPINVVSQFLLCCQRKTHP